jgi:hypothetical protein
MHISASGTIEYGEGYKSEGDDESEDEYEQALRRYIAEGGVIEDDVDDDRYDMMDKEEEEGSDTETEEEEEEEEEGTNYGDSDGDEW